MLSIEAVEQLLQASEEQACRVRCELIALAEASRNEFSGQNDIFVSPERHKEAYRITCRLLLALEENMHTLAPLAFQFAELYGECRRMMAESDREETDERLRALVMRTEDLQERLEKLRRLLARFSEQVDRAADLKHLGKGSSPEGVVRCMSEYVRALNQI